MVRLRNPYAEHPGSNCFGCSPTNASGLRMEFMEEKDEIVSIWNPGSDFQGFADVLHGGIQATVMDEIASWVVFVKLDTAGMTRELNTKYKKAVLISKGAISLRARIREVRRSLAYIDVKLYDGEGQLCSESLATYFIFPPDKAVRDLHFPGRKAFYPEEE